MGTIIVALLAITMAIFPIPVPQSVASGGHQHAITADGHEHAAVDRDHEHADELASSDDSTLGASTDHHEGSKDCSGPVCCSMGTCHAFQTSASPDIYSPAVSRTPVAMPGDKQIAGITVGGLDRPPRTV